MPGDIYFSLSCLIDLENIHTGQEEESEKYFRNFVRVLKLILFNIVVIKIFKAWIDPGDRPKKFPYNVLYQNIQSLINTIRGGNYLSIIHSLNLPHKVDFCVSHCSHTKMFDIEGNHLHIHIYICIYIGIYNIYYICK